MRILSRVEMTDKEEGTRANQNRHITIAQSCHNTASFRLLSAKNVLKLQLLCLFQPFKSPLRRLVQQMKPVCGETKRSHPLQSINVIIKQTRPFV